MSYYGRNERDEPTLTLLQEVGPLKEDVLWQVLGEGEATTRERLKRLAAGDFVNRTEARWTISPAVLEPGQTRLLPERDAEFRRDALARAREKSLDPDAILRVLTEGMHALFEKQLNLEGSWSGWAYAEPSTILVTLNEERIPANLRQLWNAVPIELKKAFLAELAADVETTAWVLALLGHLKTNAPPEKFAEFAAGVKGDFGSRVDAAVRFVFAKFERVPGTDDLAVRNPYLVLRDRWPPFLFEREEASGHPRCPKTTAFVAGVLRDCEGSGAFSLSSEQNSILDSSLRFVRGHAETYVNEVLEENSFLGQMPLYGWVMATAGYHHATREGSAFEKARGDPWFRAMILKVRRFHHVEGTDRRGSLRTHRRRDTYSVEGASVVALTLLDEGGLGLSPSQVRQLGLTDVVSAAASQVIGKLGPDIESTHHASVPIQLSQALLVLGVYPGTSRHVEQALQNAMQFARGAEREQHYNQLAHVLASLVGHYRVLRPFYEDIDWYWSQAQFNEPARVREFMSGPVKRGRGRKEPSAARDEDPAGRRS